MNTFLKTLIGGAVGLGALYVVGKVCYNLGKDVAEVEHQLADRKNEVEEDPTPSEEKEQPQTEPEAESAPKTDSEEPVKEEKRNWLVNKIHNAKAFIKIRKALGGGKSPGVLGSLLKNPEGAKIEAWVQNGGVRINVKPGVT